MRFKAVIFDLDGTLLDSLEDLADAMNSVLARNRLPSHPVEAYRCFVGDGIAMLVQRALPFQL
ncbi:MAG: HAD family hydrolase, partial [Desulfobacteraceae bacterium]